MWEREEQLTLHVTKHRKTKREARDDSETELEAREAEPEARETKPKRDDHANSDNFDENQTKSGKRPKRGTSTEEVTELHVHLKHNKRPPATPINKNMGAKLTRTVSETPLRIRSLPVRRMNAQIFTDQDHQVADDSRDEPALELGHDGKSLQDALVIVIE
jgi:hypothetical protein